MVRITLDLIRKHAEHNEGAISTLEEITLHQENIERIEVLNQLCRNLKILLMQNNIIGRIENLNMLKRLEYLNLALNNIEEIENLEGLESLKKLDLTVNFIGDLRGVKRLRCNEHLEILYLTGNPFTDYPGYREYVVATLPQLQELDMTKIERSERILALQNYSSTEGDVIRAHRNYKKLRESQINNHRQKESLKITEIDENRSNNSPEGSEKNETTDEEENSKFWNEKSLYTPEERIAIAERCQKREKKRNKGSKKEKPKYIPKLFNPEGRAYNLNQAKVSFVLDDETNRENIILEIAVYRHLDTSYLDIDVQPNYVRVTIKGKILQLCLSCEISTERSEAKRNVTTGNLVITMPRLDPLPLIAVKTENPRTRSILKRGKMNDRENTSKVVHRVSGSSTTKREFLEIGPPSRDNDHLDFLKIYQDGKTLRNENRPKSVKNVSDDFVDDPEVPPLE